MADSTLIPVRVSKEFARRLARLAKSTDRSVSDLAAEAIEGVLALQEWQVEAIRLGVAEADAGTFTSHGEARRRLSGWKRT